MVRALSLGGQEELFGTFQGFHEIIVCCYTFIDQNTKLKPEALITFCMFFYLFSIEKNES